MTESGMWIIGYGSLIFKPPPLCSFCVSGTLQGFIRRFWQSSSDHRGTPEAPGRVVTLVSLQDLQEDPSFHNDLHTYELNDRHRESDFATPSTDNLPIKNVHREVSSLHESDLMVWGVAYYVEPQHVQEVKEYLDVREQDGYSTHKVAFHVHSYPEENPKAREVMDSIPRSEDGNIYIESMIYIGTTDNVSFVGPESIHDTAKIIKNSSGPSGKNLDYLVELTKAVRHLDPNSTSRDYYLEDLAQLAGGSLTSKSK